MTLEERSEGVAELTHPLARDALTTLRDAGTAPPTFRRELERLGSLCGAALCAHRFDTERVRIRTPLTETEGERVAGRADVVLVNVLRAATPMVEGLFDVFPAAKGAMVSASRNEAAGRNPDGSFPIDVEYVKLPPITPADRVIVADPMLATGSTACSVLDAIEAAGAETEQITICAATAAPEGIERVRERDSAVEIVTVAVDDHLDEEGFIVPGLGDAGDRAFNTG